MERTATNDEIVYDVAEFRRQRQKVALRSDVVLGLVPALASKSVVGTDQSSSAYLVLNLLLEFSIPERGVMLCCVVLYQKLGRRKVCRIRTEFQATMTQSLCLTSSASEGGSHIHFLEIK